MAETPYADPAAPIPGSPGMTRFKDLRSLDLDARLKFGSGPLWHARITVLPVGLGDSPLLDSAFRVGCHGERLQLRHGVVLAVPVYLAPSRGSF